MFHTVECFVISCDDCGEDYTDEHTGFTIYNDKNSANECCQEDDWYEDYGKHYCPLCYKINDEDELIIKSERTKVITHRGKI